MNILLSLIAVLLLALLGYLAGVVGGLQFVFGVILPYVAIAIFLVGIVYRIYKWAKTPVPFRITTTCGQEKSLPWIKNAYFDAPHNKLGVIGRMALEVLLFRSLFRNTKAELREGPRLVYGEEKWLWLAAIAFHWTFLMIFLRHLRFFMEPVPQFVWLLQTLDGFMQIGAPVLYMTDVVVFAALLWLLWRRLGESQVRYISLFADYFALFLLLGLVTSGIFMRYFTKVDIVGIKEMAMGLVTFSPVVVAGVGAAFYIHLMFLTVLAAYFPFSKLTHMAGVFMSPTRNLANTNREIRHINPWDAPVKVHTYEEYEDDFRDKMVACGIPVDKQPEPKQDKPEEKTEGKE